jgi:hypothetical protein
MAAVATEGGVTTVYCHDAKGNQVSAGDGNPNSTGLDQRFVSYSVFDQPTQIRTTGANASVTRYAYGPGREIVRRTEGATVTLTTRSTHYVGGVEVSYLLRLNQKVHHSEERGVGWKSGSAIRT